MSEQLAAVTTTRARLAVVSNVITPLLGGVGFFWVSLGDGPTFVRSLGFSVVCGATMLTTRFHDKTAAAILGDQHADARQRQMRFAVAEVARIPYAAVMAALVVGYLALAAGALAFGLRLISM